MAKHDEAAFENAIEAGLIGSGGYKKHPRDTTTRRDLGGLGGL